tara:strand:- start:2721 stop:4031 length:1311 start_codon:yes stop_codon:yes gene_type:complete
LRSLRKNLLLWLLPATFLVGMLASVGTYWGVYLELEDILDDQLRYIAHHVNIDSNTPPVTLKNTIIMNGDDDKVILEVWKNQRREFSSNSRVDFVPPSKTGVVNEAVKGEVWHTFVLENEGRLVRIAQSQNVRFEALASLAIHLFWPILAMLPLLAFFLWFGIGYGLRPLQHIIEELKRRHAKSLEPIMPVQPVKEIQPFIEALNDLLKRLNHTFLLQERFIADAAHELRTPIMGLSIEMEVMVRETDPIAQQKSLSQLQQGIARLSHLVQQLLTLTKIDPQKSLQMSAPINLVSLCKSVIGEFVVSAGRKNIDLGMAAQCDVTVMGYPDDLKIVLNNLVDNAIRYIPENGKIDLSVYKNNKNITLEVSDNGPGIPKSERLRVTERFYRGKHPNIQGSGLGMNIVKHIVEHHHAELYLLDVKEGTGLCVRIVFMKS